MSAHLLRRSAALSFLLLLTACQAPARREQVLSSFAMVDVRMVESLHWGRDFEPPAKYETDENGQFALKDTLRAFYVEYTSEGDPDRRRQQRDRIAYIFFTLIKHYHDGTTDDVYELTAMLSTSFDFFSMAMGGLGAATGGTADKAGYSALAAVGIGARSSLAKNILAEQTTQAILMQMEAMRLEQEGKVRTALRDLDDAHYPLHAALTDLFDYYTAGSVKDAVAALSKAAQDSKNAAQQKLNKSMEEKPKP